MIYILPFFFILLAWSVSHKIVLIGNYIPRETHMQKIVLDVELRERTYYVKLTLD